ncbi:magnesium transporter [[Eubacterium] yurii subsp. margaretiae ATCC 43715]|nr:magnesium transporter [[Eubacterium] yurii subsp. margaretiae ATCC 43715]
MCAEKKEVKMEKILKLIQEGNKVEARNELLKYNVVDIAEFFDTIHGNDLIILFRILPKDIAAEVFSYMNPDGQKYIVEIMSDKEIEGMLPNIFMDDIVDFIEEMPANVVKKVLKNTTPDRRKLINRLLSYPEFSAGSIMTTEFVDLKKELTVKQAIERIRHIGFDRETINTMYVIDDNRRLEGIIEIRKLLLTNESALVSSLMDVNYVYIKTIDDQEDVAALFKKYGYLSMPVVDNEHRLVGIITVDDVLEVIEEENEEDFAKMNALAPSDEEYLSSSVVDLAKKRIYWLLFLMISATFTGIIIRRYEEVLNSVVILASFIPMLMDTGGNAGSQASTLIIRGLALGELQLRDFAKIIWKEFRISLLVGVILSSINFLRLYFFEKMSLNVSLTVCISMLLIVILAKVIGGVLPLLAKRLKMDPAIMAGPLITTVVDTFALVIYFNIASQLVLS